MECSTPQLDCGVVVAVVGVGGLGVLPYCINQLITIGITSLQIMKGVVASYQAALSSE